LTWPRLVRETSFVCGLEACCRAARTNWLTAHSPLARACSWASNPDNFRTLEIVQTWRLLCPGGTPAIRLAW
jgi:hypothetical protein